MMHDTFAHVALSTIPSFPVTEIIPRAVEGDRHSACLHDAWSINARGAQGQEVSLLIVDRKTKDPHECDDVVAAVKHKLGLDPALAA